MKILLSLAFVIGLLTTDTVIDFRKKSDISGWRVVNDGVMGGLSVGKFALNSDGHAVFKGEVSLANYGGFTSVRYSTEPLSIANNTTVVLRLKGDGKNYQFRVKAHSGSYFSYITTFRTSGKWEEVEIPLASLYPSYRGQKLNKPNFNAQEIEEITLLIANKRNEKFELLIDKIAFR